MTAKNTIKLNQSDTRYLYFEEGSDDLGLTLHEEGQWGIECDWQRKQLIYFREADDKYFEMTISRSGSPYSDYHYSFEDQGETLTEVKLVEKKIVRREWVAVE